MAGIKLSNNYVGIVAASGHLGMSRSTLHKAVIQGRLVPDMRTPRGHARFRPETIEAFRHTLSAPPVPVPAPPAFAPAPPTAPAPLAPMTLTRPLARISQMLTAHSDPDHICRTALALLRDQVPTVDMGYVVVRAPTEENPWNLRVAAHEGFPSTTISAYRQLGASGMLFTTLQVMRTGTMVRFDDTADPRAPLEHGLVPMIHELEARTLVIVPLAGEQRAAGAMAAMSTRPHAFGEGEIGFMKALADHLAAALVSAQALASLRAALVTASDLASRALRLCAAGARNTLADLATVFRTATGAYTVCTSGLWDDLPGTEPRLRALAQQAQDTGTERPDFFGSDELPNTGVVAVIPLPGARRGAIAAAWHGRRPDWELFHHLLTVLGAACLLVLSTSNA